jgi:hypothetical protein
LTTSTDQILASVETSDWLKLALKAALTRDPIEVAKDAEILAAVLRARAEGHAALNLNNMSRFKLTKNARVACLNL